MGCTAFYYLLSLIKKPSLISPPLLREDFDFADMLFLKEFQRNEWTY